MFPLHFQIWCAIERYVNVSKERKPRDLKKPIATGKRKKQPIVQVCRKPASVFNCITNRFKKKYAINIYIVLIVYMLHVQLVQNAKKTFIKFKRICGKT